MFLFAVMAEKKDFRTGMSRFKKNSVEAYAAAKGRNYAQARRRHCGSHRGNPKNFQIH